MKTGTDNNATDITGVIFHRNSMIGYGFFCEQNEHDVKQSPKSILAFGGLLLLPDEAPLWTGRLSLLSQRGDGLLQLPNEGFQLLAPLLLGLHHGGRGLVDKAGIL